MISALVEPFKLAREEIDDAFLPGPRLGAAACLAIYQRSYILRLRKCLEEQFPATRRILGGALFCDFAGEYLRDLPSDSYTLFELGRRFPAWLEANRPDRDLPLAERESWIDFMVDLSSYERELYRLFDAPGHEGEPWPDAATPDEELTLQSCLSLLEYRYPVAWSYHEARLGRDLEIPPPCRSFLVVLRKDYHTTTFPVTETHFRFLKTLRDPGGVREALDEIAAWTGRSAEAVERSWREHVRAPWLQAGFFVTKDATSLRA